MHNDFVNEPINHHTGDTLLQTLSKLDIKDQHLILQAKSIGQAESRNMHLNDMYHEATQRNRELERELNEARREIKRLVERDEERSGEVIEANNKVYTLQQQLQEATKPKKKGK